MDQTQLAHEAEARASRSLVSIGTAATRRYAGRCRTPRRGVTYLFPARTGEGPIGDIKKSWIAVCKAAGINGVRLHDLRHTYASVLASAGQSLPVIGALLGHTQPSTTARYAHLFDDPLRAATERVGAIVSGDVGTSADVLRIRNGG